MSKKNDYQSKQVALRQMCFAGNGKLNRNARLIIADMRRFCHADGKPMLKFSPQSGLIDPVATAAAAARREVYDRYRRMLNLDDYTDVNIREDE